MNTRILSIAAAAAIAIVSLGATAPVTAAPVGAAGQAITAQGSDLVVPVASKGGGNWKGQKGGHWTFGKHFKFHIGKAYYPAHYPYYCWETQLVPTKYGYVKKQVFVCY